MRRAFGSIALVMGALLMVLTPAVTLAQTQEPYSGASVTTTSVLPAVEVLGATVEPEGLPRTGLDVGNLALWSIVILLLGIGVLWAVGRLRAGS